MIINLILYGVIKMEAASVFRDENKEGNVFLVQTISSKLMTSRKQRKNPHKPNLIHLIWSSLSISTQP